jgi:phosphatidylethanolamine/phosphatidyl-N-methylethanolamine N-methyltransferase
VTGRAETGQAASRINGRMAFFKGFLRHPLAVGSLVPSSGYLARRIASALRSARSVVELGPGTGSVTKAMLEALGPHARLLAIELDAEFAGLLDADPDTRLIVHQGNATQLAQVVGMHGLQQVDAVVSGIPFSTMPALTGRAVLAQVWSALRPGGTFIAYQIRADVARLARGLMGRPRVGVELRNVPPMRIFAWRKPQAAAEDGRPMR